MDKVIDLYYEFYNQEDETRKKADHSQKTKELMKLRAFELTCLSFTELTHHLEQIQKYEGNLGAKLLEPEFHI